MPSSNTQTAGAGASWIARHKNGPWYTLIMLCIVAVVCGGVAAAVHFSLYDAFIASDAALDEAKGGAQRALLFPEAGSFSQVSAPEIDGLNSVWQADSGEYIFDVQSDGYHGAVELMIGVNTDGTVAGVQVVAEDETDGIGSNALTEDYLGGYAGMAATGSLSLDGSEGTQVDGVSGATFTSTAVVSDLNIAFEAYSQLGGN